MSTLRFDIVTLFPEIFSSLLSTSLVGKAVESGLLSVGFVDPRTFTNDKHHTTDDTPYGGGDGMVMKPEPVVAAIESVGEKDGCRPHRVLLSPQGQPLNQQKLQKLSERGHVLLICGRYEGFDERIRSFVDEEISLGDFVLNGGEVAAMAIIDGAARLVPGVIGNEGSLVDESHRDGLLEYPQYTRPRDFRGMLVPDVLVSGDHEQIRRWRRKERLLRTRVRRPDIFAAYQCTDEDRKLLSENIPSISLLPSTKRTKSTPATNKFSRDFLTALASRTYSALLHYPVYDRNREIVTTAITNLDVHDIARSSRTFGLAGYFIVTPLQTQQELARRITAHWREGYGATYNERRREALSILEVAPDLPSIIEMIREREGRLPITCATSALKRTEQLPLPELLSRLPEDQPLLLLFGTGWGLTEEFLQTIDLKLAPIEGGTEYNHLSVRSAAAITLDRFFGLRD